MNNQTVKPELKSPEMKAKYFAQYWGQKVVCYPNTLGGYRNVSPEHFNEYTYLLLTPLDQISDQQAKLICEALGLPMAERFYNGECFITYVDDSYTVRFYNEGFVSVLKRDRLLINETKHANDLVVSFGFATPFMGNSVEELIAAGYMQLRKGGEKKCLKR